MVLTIWELLSLVQLISFRCRVLSSRDPLLPGPSATDEILLRITLFRVSRYPKSPQTVEHCSGGACLTKISLAYNLLVTTVYIFLL